jgi:hypothetical protein
MYSFYLEGYEAKIWSCPYAYDSFECDEWNRGFRDKLDDVLR